MMDQTYPIYALLAKVPRASFHDTFFGSWKQKFWKQKLKKKLESYKFSNVRNKYGSYA